MVTVSPSGSTTTAVTYTPIATTTFSGSTATLDFTSISGYTDLILVINGSLASDQRFCLRFNSDTGSNYSYTRIYGTGSSAVSSRESSLSYAFVSGGDGTNWNTYIVQIMNYANATTYKSLLHRANDAATQVTAAVNLWRSTSAITTVTLFSLSGANFTSGTMATLYGIGA